ncbi:MAG TPA: NlpC/P60 family protein [Gaiellaceae bacterium]|nr:NlpC/P60 family protein [Gaiellaceae bacterium]
MLLLVVVAAFAAAGTATGDPSVSAKQAQAQQVMGQIAQLDSSLQRAKSSYDSASEKLRGIEYSLKINKVGLRAARANLGRAQIALAQRLVAIYTTRDQQSTLSVLLGAQSIDDLVNRIETVKSVSSQDVAVMNQVISFKHQVTMHQHALVRAHVDQKRLVAQRAAAKNRIASQLNRQQVLLVSIKGEIAHLNALAQARSLALAAAARISAQEQANNLQTTNSFGVGAQTPDGLVVPPSQYTGVVGIAMRFLGVPYVWGGSSPSGFDCSGFVAYVYAQVGVSLPHYTGAQWGVGVPVARTDLQPGDLVFFDGLGHVGIYIGGGQFIHAPHTGTVVQIASLDGWYTSNYVGARRIL